MSIKGSAVVILFTTLLLIGCSKAPEKSEATVDHVVFLWLPDSSKTVLDSIKAHSAKLDTIPGIVTLTMGTAIKSDRPIVDDSYDLGLIFTFANEKQMEQYVSHEGHTSFLRTWIKPHAERVLIYDIKRE